MMYCDRQPVSISFVTYTTVYILCPALKCTRQGSLNELVYHCREAGVVVLRSGTSPIYTALTIQGTEPQRFRKVSCLLLAGEYIVLVAYCKCIPWSEQWSTHDALWAD